MSTYDKYFSERNKSHMYKVVQQMIIQDTGIDIDNYPSYKDLFATHYPKVFEITEGEDIVDCNKTLIDTLCPTILTEIRSRTNSLKAPAPDVLKAPAPAPEPAPEPDLASVFHLFSNERLMEYSLHRYHYQHHR